MINFTTPIYCRRILFNIYDMVAAFIGYNGDYG